MTEKCLDRGLLKRLLDVIGGDPEDFDELKEEFLDSVPETLSDLQTDDLDALRVASHSLKSNARDFGATELAEACAELENACKDGAVAQKAEKVARITELANDAMVELRTLGAADLD